MIVRFFATIGILCVALAACNKSETAPNVAAETPLPEVVPAAPETAPAPAPATEAPPNPAESREWVAGEFFGGIKKGTTDAEIKEIYGAANVKKGKQYLGEGEEINALIVYGGTADEFTVVQAEGSKRITIVGKNWRSPEGIHIGTTLAELAKINGKPVTFYGFEWDYGGTITGWNGGKLRNLEDHAVLRLAFPEVGYEESLAGDSEFTTDNPAAKRMAPKTQLGQIILTF